MLKDDNSSQKKEQKNKTKQNKTCQLEDRIMNKMDDTFIYFNVFQSMFVLAFSLFFLQQKDGLYKGGQKLDVG